MNPYTPTEIHTSRLHLRTLRESDVAVVRLVNADEFRTDEAAAEYIRWISDPGRLLVNFYIWLTPTGPCIGRVYIHGKPELGGEVEIGYSILEAYRNQGYATEAGQAAVKFAFGRMGLEALCAIVKPDNAASRRVIEKLGFGNRGIRTVMDDLSVECGFDYFTLLRR